MPQGHTTFSTPRSASWQAFSRLGLLLCATTALGAALAQQPNPSIASKSESPLLEGEKLRVLKSTGQAQPQDLRSFGEGAWSGNAHLWWTGAKPGDTLELAFPVAVDGTFKLAANFTKARDYGIFDFALDGKKIAGPVDFYNASVTHTDAVALGEAVVLKAGEHTLAITVTGANPKAVKGYMLGLDYLLLAPGNVTDLAALAPKLKGPNKPADKASADVKEGNALDAQPRTPAEQLKDFTLPGGFTIELVASEETGLPKPVTTVFDNAGRLWSITATEYPRDNDPKIWQQPGKDKVVVIDRPCDPGPHTPRTFADGLVMPLGILPYGKGAFVAQGPEIFFLEDRDGDGKSDTRSPRLQGFGTQDTHTMPHQLTRMPGGRIVYSQGVLTSGKVTDAAGHTIPFNKTQIATFRPDGTGHEVIGAGLNNIWCWAHSREGRVFIHEANDLGYSLVPFEEDTSYPSFFETRLYPAAPLHPPTAQGLDLGGTGFSGLALSDDRAGSFPAPWHGLIYVANPILGRIQAVAVPETSNNVFTFKKAGDLVSCSDPMFRPVAVTFGPDGCLYITDWYNRIISHNEVARDHPGRDKTRGRIWRVRHQSQKPRVIPDISRVATAELPARLSADSTWEMRAAWHEIGDRQSKELVPALAKIIRDANTGDDVRIHALWSLEDLGVFEAALWKELLASKNPNVRRETVRALSTVKPKLAEAGALLHPLVGETAWTVRYEILRYFRRAGATPEQVAWLRPWSEGSAPQQKVSGWNGTYLALGGAYERAFQDLLLRLVTDKPAPAGSADPKWEQIVATQPVRPAAENAAMAKRIATVKAAVVAGKERPLDTARAFVEATCLACHRVGNRGIALGPPLDGSANRDTDALITSILDPDAAVENVFRAYRAETKDGTTYEGFRKSHDDKELTLVTMGGAIQKIPNAKLKSAGYIQGKSAMLPFAAGLPDEQVADIVRYLKTMK